MLPGHDLKTQVKREVEMSIDPHLVVSSIRSDPGQPTHIMRVCWEHLVHGSVIQSQGCCQGEDGVLWNMVSFRDS